MAVRTGPRGEGLPRRYTVPIVTVLSSWLYPTLVSFHLLLISNIPAQKIVCVVVVFMPPRQTHFFYLFHLTFSLHLVIFISLFSSLNRAPSLLHRDSPLLYASRLFFMNHFLCHFYLLVCPSTCEFALSPDPVIIWQYLGLLFVISFHFTKYCV